jgi:hypothetical protein
MPGQIIVPDTVDLLYSDGTAISAAARTASFDGSAVYGWRGVEGLVIQLGVTAKSAVANDKLDITIQTSFDNSTWIDIYAFTQIAGNTTAGFYIIKLLGGDDSAAGGGLAEFDNGTALSAGEFRAIFGSWYRAKVTITDGGGGHSWTFHVKLCPMLAGLTRAQV